MIECDEIISVTDIVSTKKTNVTNTTSISCHGITVRDCYILHSFISNHIIIDNYYFLLSLCKTKRYNIKMKKNKLKKACIKNFMCYYFDEIIKLEDFNLDISIDEKSHGNILIYKNS